MNYRFEISKPDQSDFRCEIAISEDQTFQQFHDKIVDTLNFDPSQMASFFAIDKLGTRGREISLMDMAVEEESENLVMDATLIRDVVNAHCIELEYVYDFLANRYLKVEYAGEYVGDSATIFPLCVYCEGELPQQMDLGFEDDWSIDQDDDYDDSFMEEFGGSRRRGRSFDDEEDFGLDDEDNEYRDEYDDGFGDRYESLDDYIDKL